jgi:hypothetical protein
MMADEGIDQNKQFHDTRDTHAGPSIHIVWDFAFYKPQYLLPGPCVNHTGAGFQLWAVCSPGLGLPRKRVFQEFGSRFGRTFAR